MSNIRGLGTLCAFIFKKCSDGATCRLPGTSRTQHSCGIHLHLHLSYGKGGGSTDSKRFGAIEAHQWAPNYPGTGDRVFGSRVPYWTVHVLEAICGPEKGGPSPSRYALLRCGCSDCLGWVLFEGGRSHCQTLLKFGTLSGGT